MRIIYVGNFSVPFCTEVHVAASLESLGHTVSRIQENETTLDSILNIQDGYDIILYTRTWGFAKGIEDFLARKRIPLIGFSLDIWFGLARKAEIKDQLFFKCDYLFTADGGHQEEFEAAGIRHFWLPPAVYRDECADVMPGRFRPDLACDVAFVGSYHYHPEYPHRPRLIDWLKATYGQRFRHYPNDGPLPYYRGQDLNDLYASVKVVVGDSLEGAFYWSDRVPETLGRGGFLIHPKTVGLDSYHSIPTCNRGNFEALKGLIDYWLDNRTDRELEQKDALADVVENHTYIDRMRSMVHILEKEFAL